MSDERRIGRERFGLCLLVASLLAPVIAQGLFLPLVHFLGPGGSAERVTGSALAIAAIVVLAPRLRLGRAPRPLLLGGLLAALASVSLSLGLAGLVTLLVVAAAIAWLEPWLSPRLPAAIDGLAARHRWLTALYVVFALAAVVSTARLSVFIGDPTRVDMSALPGDEFVEVHSCLTAYARAESLARQGVDNLYEDHWWYGSNGLPPLPAGASPPHPPFALDNFGYPPPFLLVASVLAPLRGDFLAQRALWFGLNAILLAIGLWVVARRLEGPRDHRALLLAPLLFGSMPLLITLQIGNFHVAAVVLPILAMVSIDRGRPATGGALLALAILSKISPGILGIVLLVRRELRAAAFAAGFGAILLALSVLAFGTNPLVSFVVYELPRLGTGASFPFMATESGIVTNMAPFGVAFKLQRLGLDVGDPWILGRRIANVYSLALVTLAVLGARRRGGLRHRAVTWMALLVLAGLQSPFSPAYVTIGLLWATTLLAVEVRSVRGGVGLAVVWLAIMLLSPPLLTTEVRAVMSMVQTAMTVAVCSWLVLRTPRDPEPTTPGASTEPIDRAQLQEA